MAVPTISTTKRSEVLFESKPCRRIRGNDAADAAAREATITGVVDDSKAILHQDYYPYIGRIVRDRWQLQWQAADGVKLREVKDIIGEWSSSYHRSRKVEVKLCRLRIGHTRITHE